MLVDSCIYFDRRNKSDQSDHTGGDDGDDFSMLMRRMMTMLMMAKTVMILSMQIMGCRYCAEEEGSRRIGN